jgi:nucleoside 2-deoxyribosyltransferase
MDKRNLDRCDAAVLVMPAGKSAHLELGYATGKGKKTFILMFNEPQRWDLMYKFATGVAVGMEQLFSMLKGTPPEIAYYADYEQGVLFDDE